MDVNRADQCRIEKINQSRTFLDHPDFVGIGYGPKEVGGQLTDEVSIKLYVRRKERDTQALGARAFPPTLGDFPTDVVVIAPLRARASFTQRARPVLGGASGAVHVPGLTYTGTLGLGVRGYGSHAGRFFILSNNHVLANVNQANIGDPVIQPGTLDGGDPAVDVIGTLYDYVTLQFFIPGLPLADQPRNHADAALAEVTFGEVTREIFWVGYPKGWRTKAVVAAALADAGGTITVQKTGRTTAYTQGTITDLSYDGWVDYQGSFAYFEDQLLIQPGSFSDAGDSGSVILDMEERLVGLLFAGGATHTIANHIEDVWLQLPALEFSDPPV